MPTQADYIWSTHNGHTVLFDLELRLWINRFDNREDGDNFLADYHIAKYDTQRFADPSMSEEVSWHETQSGSWQVVSREGDIIANVIEHIDADGKRVYQVEGIGAAFFSGYFYTRQALSYAVAFLLETLAATRRRQHRRRSKSYNR